MLGFAKAQLMGNITRDIELKTTASGKDVVSFSMAINSKKDGDTDYIDVVAWEQSAKTLAQYATKGKPLVVFGRLKQRTFEQDGYKRSKLELVLEQFFFIGSERREDSDRPLTQHEVLNAAHKDVVLDDIKDEPIDLSEIPF